MYRSASTTVRGEEEGGGGGGGEGEGEAETLASPATR